MGATADLGYGLRRGASRVRSVPLGSAAVLVLGLALPLSGVPPLSSAPDVFELGLGPYRVVFMPPVLIAAALLGCGILRRAKGARTTAAGGRWAVLAATCLVLGGSASLLATPDLWYSVLLGILGILTPIAAGVGALLLGTRSRLLLTGLLAGVVLMLLRADLAFLQLHGLPTPSAMLAAKDANAPYDFHYYTFNNPNGTAAYLLLPFTLAAVWLLDRRLSRPARVLLAVTALFVAANVVLTYTRSAALAALVVVLAGVWRTGTSRRVRAAVLAAVLLGTGLFLVSSVNRTFVTDLFTMRTGSSLQVRVESLQDAASAVAGRPFTGVGLGIYNDVGGYVPAHSALVQAAAEMGILGAAGLLVLLGLTLRIAWVRLRGAREDGAAAGAVTAAAAFLGYCALTGGASSASFSGYSPVWGLTLGVVLGFALQAPGPRPMTAGDGPVAADPARRPGDDLPD